MSNIDKKEKCKFIFDLHCKKNNDGFIVSNENKSAWANVYSIIPQILNVYSGVKDYTTFECCNSVKDIDISNASFLGEIKIIKDGTYKISWQANGSLQPPIPNPINSWTLGLFINDKFVEGSGSVAFVSSFNNNLSYTSGSLILNLKFGDIIKLKNLSNLANISLNQINSSFVFPITSIGLEIFMLMDN